MSIIRRVRQDNYAIIPNSVVDDERLPIDTRGTLCYLLAKPDNWQINIADIQKKCCVGRDRAYRMLKELRDIGYLEAHMKRNEKGQSCGYEYILHDVVEVREKTFPSTPTTDDFQASEPGLSFQEMDSLDTDKPLPESPNPEHNDLLIITDNKQYLNKKQTPIGVCKKENSDFDFVEMEAVGKVAGENSERLLAENPVPEKFAGREPEPLPVEDPVGGDDGFRLEAEELTKKATKTSKKTRAQREVDGVIFTRIPEDWAADEGCVKYALGKGIPADKIADEVEKFKLHWENIPGKNAMRQDWNKSWKGWILKAYPAYERQRKWDEERARNWAKAKREKEDPYAELYASLQ